MINREELLNKIQALLEKTVKNGCTESEAVAALTKAEEMMTKYGLSLSDIKTASPTDVISEWVKFGKRRTHEVQYCCTTIAQFTNVLVWADRKPDGYVYMRFFGFATDVSAATYLFQTFRYAMDFEWHKYWQKTRDLTDQTQIRVRKSFMMGLVHRLNERMSEEIKKRNQLNLNECRTMVVAKDAVLTRAMAKLGLRFITYHSKGRIADPLAYAEGKKSADSIGFGSGQLNN